MSYTQNWLLQNEPLETRHSTSQRPSMHVHSRLCKPDAQNVFSVNTASGCWRTNWPYPLTLLLSLFAHFYVSIYNYFFLLLKNYTWTSHCVSISFLSSQISLMEADSHLTWNWFCWSFFLLKGVFPCPCYQWPMLLSMGGCNKEDSTQSAGLLRLITLHNGFYNDIMSVLEVMLVPQSLVTTVSGLCRPRFSLWVRVEGLLHFLLLPLLPAAAFSPFRHLMKGNSWNHQFCFSEKKTKTLNKQHKRGQITGVWPWMSLPGRDAAKWSHPQLLQICF